MPDVRQSWLRMKRFSGGGLRKYPGSWTERTSGILKRPSQISVQEIDFLPCPRLTKNFGSSPSPDRRQSDQNSQPYPHRSCQQKKPSPRPGLLLPTDLFPGRIPGPIRPSIRKYPVFPGGELSVSPLPVRRRRLCGRCRGFLLSPACIRPGRPVSSPAVCAVLEHQPLAG